MLIGENASKEVRNSIAQQMGAVEHVNEVLTMHMGPDYILVNLSVDLTDSLQVDEVERTRADLNRNIRSKFPEMIRVVVQAEARGARASTLR